MVYLQDVVRESLAILKERCTTYRILTGENMPCFTAVMIKTEAVDYKDSHISLNEENLIQVEVCKYDRMRE